MSDSRDDRLQGRKPRGRDQRVLKPAQGHQDAVIRGIARARGVRPQEVNQRLERFGCYFGGSVHVGEQGTRVMLSYSDYNDGKYQG